MEHCLNFLLAIYFFFGAARGELQEEATIKTHHGCSINCRNYYSNCLSGNQPPSTDEPAKDFQAMVLCRQDLAVCMQKCVNPEQLKCVTICKRHLVNCLADVHSYEDTTQNTQKSMLCMQASNICKSNCKERAKIYQVKI